MTRLEVHIECLVLEGYRHEDRHAIAASLEAELTRALAVPGAIGQFLGADRSGAAPPVALRLAHAATPAGIGRVVARGIAAPAPRAAGKGQRR
jgi:hypothetical protein